MLKQIVLAAALVAPNATEEITIETETITEETIQIESAEETTPEADTATEAEEPEFYETPGGLVEEEPIPDDTYETPEEEAAATADEAESYSCPEEEFPQVEPEYATPEEEAIATGTLEVNNEPTPEEEHLQWVEICNSYVKYEPEEQTIYYQVETPKAAPTIAHDINKSDITALNNPYFNKKPYTGITVTVCEV